MTDGPHQIAVRECTKRYGATLALDAVSVTLDRGRVRSLAGVNGSGKSTLLKILSGQVAPDDGAILVGGRERVFRGPADALRHGVAIVSQERTLVPDLSVAENLFLGGRMVKNAAGISWKATEARARTVLTELGVGVDPRTPVRQLAPNLQQLVEIARAVATGAQFVLLDEPTSSLTADEVTALLRLIRSLCSSNVGVAYVSHRLDEVMHVSDDVTVLRDGRCVSAGAIAQFSEDRLILDMLGRAPVALEAPKRMREAAVLLDVTSFEVPGAVADASFTVNRGEIVGVAGLEGSGRSELLAALFGSIRPSAGTVTVAGRRSKFNSPRRSMSIGMSYVPPDRKLEGLALNRSVAENLLLGYTAGRWSIAPRKARADAKRVDELIRKYLIKCASPSIEVRRLSGGNQQKVLLARSLQRDPRVLLLDEPTRGVDVGAKREIYTLLDEARRGGMGIVVASGEMEELVQIADRVLVMHRGRIVADVDQGTYDADSLVAIAAGHGTAAAATTPTAGTSSTATASPSTTPREYA